ncbi:MAG: HD-GYP domain-containing protein [Planctomycetes bacterium]|nr:HD-GYP domain-containing protein [Planctomycetota bacterium]MBU4354351.1 HD-GYP domain-containing protein [Pseudomonadota bacterium]MCG2771506.1 HD-GYP domain-containing protein [Desulfobacterales bacterium]
MCVITQVIEATMKAKDPYTVQHQQRVTQIALSIAGQMGLPADSMEKLRIAGTLHDLGKISIPNEILVKPGRLSDLEFAIVKTHPLVGYDILNPVEFPQSTTQIILQHHERWNGSGYPHGLSGDNILLEARILGVADVVEAMAADRPYRPALGIDRALEEISHNKGSLYDPTVAEACSRFYSGRKLNILN